MFYSFEYNVIWINELKIERNVNAGEMVYSGFVVLADIVIKCGKVDVHTRTEKYRYDGKDELIVFVGVDWVTITAYEDSYVCVYIRYLSLPPLISSILFILLTFLLLAIIFYIYASAKAKLEKRSV